MVSLSNYNSGETELHQRLNGQEDTYAEVNEEVLFSVNEKCSKITHRIGSKEGEEGFLWKCEWFDRRTTITAYKTLQS